MLIYGKALNLIAKKLVGKERFIKAARQIAEVKEMHDSTKTRDLMRKM
jgi:hypothetical protein